MSTGLLFGVKCVILKYSPLQHFTPEPLMRRTSKAGEVGWHCEVSFDQCALLEELLPIRGAFASVVTLGLRSLLDQLESNRDLLRLVHEDIQRHLYAEPREGKMRGIGFRVPETLYTRFNRVLPEWGATTWFIRRLIRAMVQADNALASQVDVAVMKMLMEIPVTVVTNGDAHGPEV